MHTEEYGAILVLDDDYTEEQYNACMPGGYLIQAKFFCTKETEDGLQKEHAKKAEYIFAKQAKATAKQA